MLHIRRIVNQHRGILMKRSLLIFFTVLVLFPCFALADGWKCEFNSYITRQEYVDVPYSTWNPGDAGEFGSIGSYGYSERRYRRELQNVRYDYPTRFYLYSGGNCIYEGTAPVTITNLIWGNTYIVKWYSPSTNQWQSGYVSNSKNQSKIYMNLD